MRRIEGKVAIITGAGSGIGRATAMLFAEEGAKVVAADRDVDGGNEIVAIIKREGGVCTFVKTDVTCVADVKGMVNKAVDTYGRLDILFNSAGIVGDKITTADYAEETWDEVINVNLRGTFLGMKYAIPEILKAGGGSIINMSSNVAHVPPVGLSAYSASKAGIIALTRAAAMEYLRNNIRINYISPGCVLTPVNEPFEKVMKSQLPLGRLAQPKEVAHVVLFLASDESSFVTASGVIADGGQTAYNPYPNHRNLK